MSEKSPAFPLYAADFLSDENQVAMSLEACGAYIRLLAYSWREGSIPADMNKAAKLINASSAAIKRVWPQLMPCFVSHPTEPGRLVNKRIEKERIRQATRRAERAESGAKGAASKWKKEPRAKPVSGDGSANGSAIEQPIANDGFSVSCSPSPPSGVGPPADRKPENPLLVAMSGVCGFRIETLTDGNRQKLHKAMETFREILPGVDDDYRARQLVEFPIYFKTKGFKDSTPSPNQIVDFWDPYQAWRLGKQQAQSNYVVAPVDFDPKGGKKPNGTSGKIATVKP